MEAVKLCTLNVGDLFSFVEDQRHVLKVLYFGFHGIICQTMGTPNTDHYEYDDKVIWLPPIHETP